MKLQDGINYFKKNKAQTIIIVIGAIALIGAVIWAIYAIQKSIGSFLKGGANQGLDQSKAAIANITVNSANLTITDASAQSLADSMFNCLNIQIWYWPLYNGSKSDLWELFAPIKNADDANFVIKKFGTKAPTLHVAGVWTPKIGDEMGLIGWLYYQLNAEDYQAALKVFFQA